MPVPIVSTFGSNMMSSGGKRTSFTKMSYERLQILTFSDSVAACPSSSKAITTTAHPCFFNRVACSLNNSSPTFKDIEFTMHFPWHHFKPANTISNLDASSMKGTLATSGSVTAILTNFCIAARPSNMPSSTLISITWAPSSTCFLAISIAVP